MMVAVYLISLNQLIFEVGGEFAEKFVSDLCEGVGASDDGAEVAEKKEKIFTFGSYLYSESSNGVDEVKGRGLLIVVVCVFFVGVLISVIVVEKAFVIPSRDDVDVIVDGLAHALLDCFVLEKVQTGFRVFGFDGREVVFASEVQFVYTMAHIELLEESLYFGLHVLVHVGVAADVKVAWDLLDSEGAYESAAVST